MFNLKKQHQELNALSNELRDIRHELVQAQRYYMNHPEEHIPAFSDKTSAPRQLQQLEALMVKVDTRYWSVNSQLHARKYKKFNRK